MTKLQVALMLHLHESVTVQRHHACELFGRGIGKVFKNLCRKGYATEDTPVWASRCYGPRWVLTGEGRQWLYDNNHATKPKARKYGTCNIPPLTHEEIYGAR